MICSTTKHKNILNGKICHYCYQPTEFVDSSVVYDISYGMIYLCKPCDAYVGAHKSTNIALGRLANMDLRHWKKEAHKFFDPLWKKKMTKGFSKHKARGSGYKWLSEQMGLHIDLTHIGMMDVEQVYELAYNSAIDKLKQLNPGVKFGENL